MSDFIFFSKSHESIIGDIVKGDSKAFEADILRGFIKLLPDNTEVSIKNRVYYIKYIIFLDSKFVCVCSIKGRWRSS